MNLFQIDITEALTNLKQRVKIENLPENIQDEFLLKLLFFKVSDFICLSKYIMSNLK